VGGKCILKKTARWPFLILFGLIDLVIGGGSKILIFELVCCLWSWQVSWGLRRRHQKSCSRGSFAAFSLGGFHGVCGGGIKILIFELVCCL